MKRLSRLFEVIEVGASGDRLSRFYDFFGVCCVVVNLTAIILLTFEEIAGRYFALLTAVEWVTVLFFLVDYVLRIVTARFLYPQRTPAGAALRYAVSFTGIIDLLSFLPFLLPFFFPEGAIAFRLFRLARVFRLFRIGAYYDSLHVITQVLRAKRQQLLSSVFIILVLMLAASLCMYSIEHTAQPDIFKNAFSGIWWAVSTLLTVGYGDIYPVTAAGRAFSIVLTFLGVGLVAIPTGIISAGFVEQYAVMKRQADYIRETDVNFIKFRLRESDSWVGKAIAALPLPKSALIAIVRRGSKTIVPKGDLVLLSGDTVVLGAEPYNDYQDVQLKEIILSRHSDWVGKRPQDLDISRQTLVVTVRRGDRLLIPDERLIFRARDKVILFSKRDVRDAEGDTDLSQG